MSTDDLVQDVRRLLFGYVKRANDLDEVRWLMSVDDAFDGGDFDTEDFGNLRWRLDVLRDRLQTDRWERLVDVCQRVLDGARCRERNDVGPLGHCGDLRRNVPPVPSPNPTKESEMG